VCNDSIARFLRPRTNPSVKTTASSRRRSCR
jgi:hypothetical protein